MIFNLLLTSLENGENILPYSALIHSFSALPFVYGSFKLYSAYKKYKTNLFYYFFRYFVFTALGFLAFALPNYIVPLKYPLMKWGYIFGHIFVFIGIAYLLLWAFSLRFPSLKIPVLTIMILATAGIVFTELSQEFPIYLAPHGFTIWEEPLIVAIFGSIAGITTVFPIIITFYFALKSSLGKTVQLKAWLLGISLIIYVVGGPLHSFFVFSPIMPTLGDFSMLLAGILMLFSLLFQPATELG